VGFNLFVLQGMTDRQITWIARQAIPMFLLMCAAVAMIWIWPQITLWLPAHMKMGG
jgi:TRAP-type C4-dicarboxylate transport system permease large subunit